jgi:hypothetical protein
LITFYICKATKKRAGGDVPLGKHSQGPLIYLLKADRRRVSGNMKSQARFRPGSLGELPASGQIDSPIPSPERF